MNDLIAKLAQIFGQQKPPVPPPNEGIDMARPWDSPVLRPPVAATPRTPPSALVEQDMARIREAGGLSDPDLALVLAQQMKKRNQNFVGAGNTSGIINEPVPR